MLGVSWGVWWGLNLERPAFASLPPEVIRELERSGVIPAGTWAGIGGLLTTRRNAKTWRPELALCPGPRVLARTGLGTVDDLYGSTWAVGVYDGGPHLFQARAGIWVERSDAGALSELRGDVRHVSLAFDQAARPVVAWERNGSVYVRQWDGLSGEFITRGPWPGRDPLVWCDAVLLANPGDSDVLLFHLDGAGVVVRAQREVYAVGRQLLALPAGAVLDQLTVQGHRLQILGEYPDGTRLVVSSKLFPLFASDSLQATARVAGWFEDMIIARGESSSLTASASLSGLFESVAAVLAVVDNVNATASVTGLLDSIQKLVTVTDNLMITPSLAGALATVGVPISQSDGLTTGATLTGAFS